MISTHAEESESEPTSIGTWLECPTWLAYDGVSADIVALFDFFEGIRGALSGSAACIGAVGAVELVGTDEALSLLAAGRRFDTAVSGRGDCVPVSSALNMKYQGHDFWNSSTPSAVPRARVLIDDLLLKDDGTSLKEDHSGRTVYPTVAVVYLFLKRLVS